MKISIVGFGRFGKILYRLLKDDFTITIYDRSNVTADGVTFTRSTRIASHIEEIYKSDVIFYAVPISSFENVICTHKKYFRNHHVLIDVLSVKVHPEKVLTRHLKGMKTQALLTHPMFGPDSIRDGVDDLPIIVDKFLAKRSTFIFWKKYFQMKKLRVIEMSAREHDHIAANSQGLTHFIGRLLDEYNFSATAIDSIGAKKLLQVADQTCNDSWQLFTDLQQFNPFTNSMRMKLGVNYDKLYNKLLPKQVKKYHVTFGIQGGKGSFNEEALFSFLGRAHIKKYQIKYLYTSENVLRALHRGEIDCGQFALHNSVGGIVDESIEAMARYKFKIKEQFSIKISHALMMRPDAELRDITTVMAHPQALAQCKTTLAKKYPQLKLSSGKNILIDHAVVAKRLAEKKISKHVATLGSSKLAELYNLKIIEENLQDAKENFTSFLHVVRFVDR